MIYTHISLLKSKYVTLVDLSRPKLHKMILQGVTWVVLHHYAATTATFVPYIFSQESPCELYNHTYSVLCCYNKTNEFSLSSKVAHHDLAGRSVGRTPPFAATTVTFVLYIFSQESPCELYNHTLYIFSVTKKLMNKNSHYISTFFHFQKVIPLFLFLFLFFIE